MRNDHSIFPWVKLDRSGQAVRSGYVIRIKEHGQWKTWGKTVFPTEDSANVTAARCVNRDCDIVPAREIVHRIGKPGRDIRLATKIIVDETRV